MQIIDYTLLTHFFKSCTFLPQVPTLRFQTQLFWIIFPINENNWFSGYQKIPDAVPLKNNRKPLFSQPYQQDEWIECMKKKYPDGQIYEGEYKWSRLRRIRHGQGTYTFLDGTKYEGEWKDGDKHGQGILTFLDGAKYEGEFKDGKFNGQGIYTYSSGATYEGEWKDGEFNGQGTYTDSDGTKYEGEFKDGEYVGK
jgi:hypothetical protein